MKPLPFLLLLVLFGACREQAVTKTISPKEKIIALPYNDFISTSASQDTITELNSFIEVKNLWIIGAQNGIYFIDRQTKQVHKYFKFEITGHEELFDGQDSIVGFLSTDFVINNDTSKLLVYTSNGIAFQIDLKNHEIDWLVKFIHRIETATYSDNGGIIAIGTRYDRKSGSNKANTEYYSSLFLINGQTGQYIDHFNESASVKKILFKDKDSKLLVAYDWNSTDSYLWEMNNKEKSIAQFREDNSFIYDIALLDDKHFATVNTKGISLWDTEKPDQLNQVYSKANSGFENLLRNKLTQDYVLVAYSKLYFFDKQFNLKDSLQLPVQFEGSDYSNNDSIIILKNLMNNNAPPTEIDSDGKEGFYTFSLATKKLDFLMGRNELNEIIKASPH